MRLPWSRISTLLCLILVIQLVSAEGSQLGRRQDDKSIDSKTKPSDNDGEATRTASSEKQTEEAESNDSETGSNNEIETPTATATRAARPTNTEILTDGALDNSTFVNVTIPAGQLPLQPRITPGWGVAGIIMLLTGLAHTLIGIKNRFIHTFFSTAYAAALGVTVLIVYVMSLPVSDGIQGGYVVAAIMSGCALGAAATFFREITEGLGCALGGFCVSMWLLTLAPGGLIQPVASKAIFIASFTLGAFVFYFSRWTRDWALILMISFSGATVMVLGIDCFSRAGLKEFWAYSWDLNEKLFPDGADTYPVTKGIRVESAAIIIFFLFGIVSQIKLWKLIREQRQKREAELAEGQRNLEQEEANVGRNIEELNARERRQWERVYGDGEVGSSTASRTSESGDVGAEKKLGSSHSGSSQRQSQIEAIELSDMTDAEQPARTSSTLMAGGEHEGGVTIQVASDELPRQLSEPDTAENVAADSSEGPTLPVDSARESRRVSRNSQGLQPPPAVVPLPFTVPVVDDLRSNADRSSVATFADDEDDTPVAPGRRHSLAQRLSHLSQGSAGLIRTFSQRSGFSHGNPKHGEDEGREELVMPALPRDDSGSLAATVDDDSLSGGDRRSITSAKDIHINAELADAGMRSPSTNEPPKLQDPDGHEGQPSEAHSKTRSVASGISAPVSFTKDRLPRSLSRVALSYRTNEWAKHLSNADAPELEELHIGQRPVSTAEKPAPVFVDELKQTATEGTPAPILNRSDSYTSNVSYASKLGPGRQTVPATLAILTGDGPNRGPESTSAGAALPRGVSSGFRRTSTGIEPIAEEHRPAQAAAPFPEAYDARHNSMSSPLPQHEARSPTPGVVSYSSPQTLIGQRELFLRNKSQGNLLGTSASELNVVYRASSDAGSMHNYSMYAAGVGADVDDLPLSQRKQLMHHQSMMNVSASTPHLNRMTSSPDVAGPDVAFNSHQPQRQSSTLSAVAREAALASFRDSVQRDLRSGTPVIKNSGRETPFSPMSLLADREAEVQRNIEMGRNIMMGQKEAEAQRRERGRREREMADRAFDERMRNGDMLDAHREVLRKMQGNAKE